MFPNSFGPPLIGENSQQERSSAADEGRLRVAHRRELDVAQLPVLAKNLAKNFMNTFFAERGSRLTLDESVRLSAQVRRSSFYFCSNTPVLVPTPDDAIMLSLMLCR
jgi:hypothetical protein